MDVVLRLYWSGVLEYAARILGSEDAGEEVAQLTFVKLWLSRDKLDGNGSLNALLFRIARNAALDELKRGGRDTQFVGLHDNELQAATTPADEVIGAELADRLTRAIHVMPIARREVFLLLRYAGLSHKEVASLLELSPQTVANHMSLALKELKRTLRPDLDLT